MIVNKYLEQYNGIKDDFRQTAPRITCKDGVTLSVQVGKFLYCTPRTDYGPYSKVEVGFPSIRPPDSWEPYFEGEWQVPGLIGSLVRIWQDRSMVWHGFKTMRKYKSSFTLKNYLRIADNATNSIYAWIPIELVDKFIREHGGISPPPLTTEEWLMVNDLKQDVEPPDNGQET